MTLKKLFLIVLAFLLVFSAINVASAANSTINSTMSSSLESTAMVSNGRYVVWEDDRDGEPQSSSLYYKDLVSGAGSRCPGWTHPKSMQICQVTL